MMKSRRSSSSRGSPPCGIGGERSESEITRSTSSKLAARWSWDRPGMSWTFLSGLKKGRCARSEILFAPCASSGLPDTAGRKKHGR